MDGTASKLMARNAERNMVKCIVGSNAFELDVPDLTCRVFTLLAQRGDDVERRWTCMKDCQG